MNRAVKIVIILLSAMATLALALLVYYFAVTAGEKLDMQKLSLNENCVLVFDKNGEEIKTAQKSAVALDALPDYLPNAFVAVEDKRFYTHHGLDYRRMMKAALKNAATFSFREGASTISQQLIKNTHLTGEKTIRRKLKEIKLTRALERRFSKREILELYLNSIYFGHSAFGVGSAAEYYFGSAPSELTPAECAMLAALVRSPNRYSPFTDPEKCLARRNFVLSLMREQGYLTPEEETEARAEPLPLSPCEREESAYLVPVFAELARLFPDAQSGDKLRVYTALDPALQRVLEEQEAGSDVCIAVRGAEGGVKAFFSTCGVLKRLPASTIKPLAVYAPAIEENLISPATPLLDEKTDFGGYSPADYGGKYGGYMSVRYALSRSVNVPAVKVLNSLGVERAASYLEKLGLPVPAEDRTLALALGGMKEGYPLLSLLDGYASFARGGVYSPAYFIERVEDCQGKLLYSSEKCQGKELDRRVFSEDTAYLINDMLMTAAREGTAKKLKSLPFEVAAKTGTGGTAAQDNTDAYTIAYTSEDAVGVWLGNRDNSPIEATGGGLPANIALRVLKALYGRHSPAPFPRSDGVACALLDKEEYEKNHRLLLADPLAPEYLSVKELFRKSALPEGTSEKFSRPKIQKPEISVVNGSVKIVLCQTEYYDYEVKRQCGDQISTVYKGKYRRELFDNSVCGGKNYVYSVTPYYCGIAGETVTLPSVHIETSDKLPDDWWQESALSRRSHGAVL